jgi:hypothetical protein
LTEFILRVPGATEDNLVVFAKNGKIKNSDESVLTLMGEITGRIKRSGDIMYGDLSMSRNTIINVREPKSDDDVATKKYVDSNGATIRTQINKCVAKTGDAMTGSLNFG